MELVYKKLVDNFRHNIAIMISQILYPLGIYSGYAAKNPSLTKVGEANEGQELSVSSCYDVLSEFG